MKKLLLIIILIMAIFQMVAISANLFVDDFESGNLTAWTSETDSGGYLNIGTEAVALHGTYGMSVEIPNTTGRYVAKTLASNQTRLRSRCYINTNSIAITNNTEVNFMYHYNAVGNIFTCLRNEGGVYKIRLITNDDSTQVYTSSYAISNGVHCVEVDWKASSGDGNNDGFIELLIDGTSKETVSNIDSDTRTTRYIRFGAVSQIAAGTSGTIYLDDYVCNNTGDVIGVIAETPTGNAIMFGINF